jgi:hypothetical protein
LPPTLRQARAWPLQVVTGHLRPEMAAAPVVGRLPAQKRPLLLAHEAGGLATRRRR